MGKLLKKSAVPWLVIGAAAVIALVVFSVLYSRSHDREGMERELAKDLVQLVVILILGSVVNEALKERERERRWREREQDREHQEEARRALFREQVRKRISETYQAVKRARALLRVGGLTPERLELGIAAGEAGYVEVYRRELEAINEAQLDLEKIWRELECFQELFANAPALIRRLKIMSGYLRRLLDEYERNCNRAPGTEAEIFLEHDRLTGLVASTKDSEFKQRFCDRYSEATELISQDILRPVVGGAGRE